MRLLEPRVRKIRASPMEEVESRRRGGPGQGANINDDDAMLCSTTTSDAHVGEE